MDAVWNDELDGRFLNSGRYYGTIKLNVCWSVFRNISSGLLGFLKERNPNERIRYNQ